DHNATNQAESEIIALADNTSPGDFAGQKTAGELLLRARMWSRALQEFQTVLSHDSGDEDAIAGAATAAFELGQYAEADEYLERLPRDKLSDPELMKMHEVSRSVVSLTPFGRGLSVEVRAKRTAQAIALAQARASDCERQNGGPSATHSSASSLQS